MSGGILEGPGQVSKLGLKITMMGASARLLWLVRGTNVTNALCISRAMTRSY